MATVSFTSIINIRGINPYVPVSAARANKIKAPWRKPMPVLLRVNGEPKTPWRINMMPRGDGGFYLYLHGQVRKAAGVTVGDRVNVSVAFDARYKGGPQRTPAWFASALRNNDKAHGNWKKLSPSRKKEMVRYLGSLKSTEARERNLKKAIAVLAGKNDRFMARTWRAGK